jgi:hypothetical protein
MDELADARNARLVEAGEGIPTVLWGVLAVGGILVVGFAYLFGLENTLVHKLMVGALALLISSVLFTIGVLEYPFSGDVRVSPEAFELVLERFERSKLSELWCEPHFPDSAHSQLPTFRACCPSNSTGGRYPRLECNRFSL